MKQGINKFPPQLLEEEKKPAPQERKKERGQTRTRRQKASIRELDF